LSLNFNPLLISSKKLSFPLANLSRCHTPRSRFAEHFVKSIAATCFAMSARSLSVAAAAVYVKWVTSRDVNEAWRLRARSECV